MIRCLLYRATSSRVSSAAGATSGGNDDTVISSIARILRSTGRRVLSTTVIVSRTFPIIRLDSRPTKCPGTLGRIHTVRETFLSVEVCCAEWGSCVAVVEASVV
jgi:hypothetical protein